MRKFILWSILVLMVSSCGYEIREETESESPKPKLTKEQMQQQEYEEKLKDYEVVFLFECNGVKVYRFQDSYTGEIVYFTNTNGRTYYEYTKRTSRYSHKIIKVQSLNTNE